MELFMRSRLLLFTLALYMAFTFGCSSKPASDAAASAPDAGAMVNAADNSAPAGNDAANQPANQPAAPAPMPKKQRVVVRAGTTVTVSLGSDLGSKLSEAGQTFEGTTAKDIMANGVVAIRRGTTIRGTVTDAKPLGRFAGGAVLQLRLDSIRVKGSNIPVQAELLTFTEKGKGKRTAMMTGGGAAVGGLIGGLAGGGKGAAIGLVAGGGAGAGGAAMTGNKNIVLPAESSVSFALVHPVELR
jgi:hypothetical protein